MAVLRFRVYWEDDDQIYRDIELIGGQSFQDFNQIIISAYEFKDGKSAMFFESNDRWQRGRALSSEVLVNKKDAPALSMVKTPVSALVATPTQKFVYEYDPVKQWTFLVELIGIDKEESSKKNYPLCIRKEGIAPFQTGAKAAQTDKLLELEEKYDLGEDEMAEGYGSEGEESTDTDSIDEVF